MLLTPEIFIAMRCPYCQRQILFRTFSVFSFRNNIPQKIMCNCGAEPLSISISGKKHVYIDMICPACPDEHSYIYSLDEIKKNQVVSLTCLDTGVHLAYIGRRGSVLKALNEEGHLIIDYEEELRDYFLHPVLMGRILLCFNSYLMRDKVRCAKCDGKDYDLEVFSDRAVLHCVNCESTAVLSATRKSDLYVLKKLKQIILRPSKDKWTVIEEKRSRRIRFNKY